MLLETTTTELYFSVEYFGKHLGEWIPAFPSERNRFERLADARTAILEMADPECDPERFRIVAQRREVIATFDT